MPGEPTRYELRYLPLFWDDLNEAVSYIADVLRNPNAAARLLDQTEEGILRHRQSPTMCTVYHSETERPLPYYWFAVGNYMVFYVVRGNVMEVRRFLYGSRDLTRIHL